MEFTGPKEVVIKRVPRAGYFGITAYPKSTTTLGCELGKNGFKTGLTPEEEKYYEVELGLKPGELGKHSKWWGDVFNIDYAIRLNNTKETRMILEDKIKQVTYKVLLASSKVANSEIDKKDPWVDFYIVDEEAKARAESEIFDYEWEAMELLLKLTPEEKRSSLRLFGKAGVDSLSEMMLKSELTKEIKKDPKAFCTTLKDKQLKTRMLIEELLEYRIITKNGTYYKHGEDSIGASTEEALEYFDNLKNQSVVLTMTTRLKKAKKDK